MLYALNAVLDKAYTHPPPEPYSLHDVFNVMVNDVMNLAEDDDVSVFSRRRLTVTRAVFRIRCELPGKVVDQQYCP